MSRTIYLIRHCQTSGQEPDAPLTECGQKQAFVLAQYLSKEPITRVVSSPLLRAYQSAQPLAKLCGLSIQVDERLRERVLCGGPLPQWREKLEKSFTDLDLCLPGGESSRAAMERGRAAITDIAEAERTTTAVVTHGNLLALILKSFDDAAGFAQWQGLTSPDVYRVEYREHATRVERAANALD